jgi:chemotaxis protein MotB
MARRKPAASKTPEWLVTFADLMSILVCFFVLLISFSIQDVEKLQVIAGSMREAFGTARVHSVDGVIERLGKPQRDFIRDVGPSDPQQQIQIAPQDDDVAELQGPKINTRSDATAETRDARFAMAAPSLRQAWQALPDITNYADNLIVEETDEGLNILITDQQGREMFPEGSKFPHEFTRRAVAAMAPLLQQMPGEIAISGHTAAGTRYPDPRYGQWELSTDRANVIRQILEEFGLSRDRVRSVSGRADTEPFFPTDPYLAANQRVSILLLYEQPPVPLDLEP